MVVCHSSSFLKLLQRNLCLPQLSQTRLCNGISCFWLQSSLETNRCLTGLCSQFRCSKMSVLQLCGIYALCRRVVSQSNLRKSHTNGKYQDMQLRMTHDVDKLDLSYQEEVSNWKLLVNQKYKQTLTYTHLWHYIIR